MVLANSLLILVQAHATELISKPENDATMVSSLLTFKRFCDSSIASLYDPTDPAYPAAFKTAAGETKEARRRLALEGEVRDGLKAGMETRQAVPAELIGQSRATGTKCVRAVQLMPL